MPYNPHVQEYRLIGACYLVRLSPYMGGLAVPVVIDIHDLSALPWLWTLDSVLGPRSSVLWTLDSVLWTLDSVLWTLDSVLGPLDSVLGPPVARTTGGQGAPTRSPRAEP